MKPDSGHHHVIIAAADTDTHARAVLSASLCFNHQKEAGELQWMSIGGSKSKMLTASRP